VATNPNPKKRQNQSKQSPKRSGKTFFKMLSFWGLILSGFAMSGAALSMILSAKPLSQPVAQQKQSSIPLKYNFFNGLEQPINILILGIDNTEIEPRSSSPSNSASGLSGNSDTMLLVRLLPKTHEINVLSIPRDTLVELPGVGIDKINDANHLGGTALAAQSVSHLVGDLQIDRSIRLGTNGLTYLVDAVGGVSIDVPKPMDYVDKTQHLKIHFTAGRQHLTGQQLQEYVRFRHDELGDIGRVQRQQVVLRALADTILKPQMLSKIPNLVQVLRRDVETDLSVEEMLAVTHLIAKISSKQINFVMLPGRFSRPDEYELSYWIADPERLNPIVSRYFSDSKFDTHNDRQSVSTSNLKIAISNASGRPGADYQLVQWLRNKGFSSVYVTDHEMDASSIGKTTQILAQHGNPKDASDLQKVLSIGQVQVESTGDFLSDITVVIGSDLADQLLR
jgi:polyisoprenyl-teichoic acid--peptidoglycan teichoic acid transferase